jgi:hypothetical protein
MPELSTHVVHCPYCGEPLELVVDASAGAQRYVEDCMVCCRPIEVELDVDEGDVRIAARHENEA